MKLHQWCSIVFRCRQFVFLIIVGMLAVLFPQRVAGERCFNDMEEEELCHPGDTIAMHLSMAECCSMDNAKAYSPTNLLDPNTEYFRCKKCEPPVDGGWSEWGPYSPCSATCGQGVQYRQRKCNNPKPSELGKICPNQATQWREIVGCQLKECQTTTKTTTPRTTFIPISTTRLTTTSAPTRTAAIQTTKAALQTTITSTTSSQTSSRITSITPNISSNKMFGLSSVFGFPTSLSTISILGATPTTMEPTSSSFQASWGSWMTVGTCSVTCGYGLVKKTRLCLVNGQTVETNKCEGRSSLLVSCVVNDCPTSDKNDKPTGKSDAYAQTAENDSVQQRLIIYIVVAVAGAIFIVVVALAIFYYKRRYSHIKNGPMIKEATITYKKVPPNKKRMPREDDKSIDNGTCSLVSKNNESQNCDDYEIPRAIHLEVNNDHIYEDF